MHPLPHVYRVGASSGANGEVRLTADAVADLPSNSPPEFDGPGGVWSPETLLCAAVVDCFILTFRAVARASKFEWTGLECRVEGTLERVDGVTRFTRFTTHAMLRVAPGTDEARARLLLDKAEHGCLVANSLSAERVLHSDIASG
jgi:organic hydroperoxide reductase OsmC/OhrA